MQSVPEAVAALGTELHKKGVKIHVQNAFDNLASCLVLLNSPSPSIQMIRKLCTVLRQPLLPLYNACLQPALQLSCAVLSTVLGKLCDTHKSEGESSRAAWDATAEVILSGILDFLDQTDGANIKLDGAAWEVLYRIICEFFFLGSGRGLPAFSIPLCLSAYNTLTEVAAREISIQNALRRRAVLGGERLGAAISGTRDYLLLEALLLLFARLLPAAHNTSEGKPRRFKFVKEVLGSSKLFKCSTELVDIMQNTSGTHWDDIAARIIDALGRTDITYPQPFSIDEIDVCGRVFPQPLATDRLIVDKQGFLANIVAEDDNVCESLQVPYSHIRTITLDNSEKNVPRGKVLIMLYLTSPPLVANTEMQPPGEILRAKFLLQNAALSGFMEALRRRGVGKLNFLNPPARVERKRKGISMGSEFRFINDSSPVPPTASFEGKVKHVNEVYNTDIEDPTTAHTVPSSHVGDAGSSVSKPSFKDEGLIPETIKSAAAEDVPSTIKSARLAAPADEMAKPIQNPASRYFPGNSTKTHLSGDNDQLSKISEFEPDDHAANEGAETGASASCNNGFKPLRHRIARTQKRGHSTATSEISSSPSETVDRTEGAAQKSLETGNPLLTMNSPTFRSSSSTQIDVSPKPLSNIFTTASTEGSLSVTSQIFVGADMLENAGVHECGPSDTEHVIEKVQSRIEIAKGSSVPPKIAGRRRKREPIKSSTKDAIEDDGSAPPWKKSRNDRLGIEEDKVKPKDISPDVIPISKMKRCTKTAKRSPGTIDLTVAVDFDELAELKPTCQGTRRSSRIKKRQTAATSGTRPSSIRGKSRKGDQTDDASVEVGHGTPSILSLRPIPSLVRESPFPTVNGQPLVELSSARSIAPETNLPQEMLKGGNEWSRASIMPGDVPRGKLDFIQGVAPNAMQLVQEQSHTKAERVKANKAQKVVECLVSSKMGEDPVEPSRPVAESTPRTETVTIDLTIDDSPAQEWGELHKASVDLECSDVDIRTKLKTPGLSDTIAIEEPSPRHRRRSVTFASPIEYVLDKTAESKAQVRSSSCRYPSPSESNTLSPLRIPTVALQNPKSLQDNHCSFDMLNNTTHNEASVHDKAASEDGIQGIVEVLDEIQAVIIKGISDKFRNVKKDVQHSRDELIQQVLDELRAMAVENAKYFNGLLRLEEDYHNNCKAITRCWEELIDCTDGIAVQFQNALKEHDQDISAGVFPKSLISFQPVF